MKFTASKGNWHIKYLVLLLTLTPCIASATEWKQVFGDYEYTVSVDVDSIEHSTTSVKAWVQQHFLKERSSADFSYNILNGLNSFQCKNKKVSLLQVDVYRDNKLMESHKIDKSGMNRPIIPGTVEFFAYKYLCGTNEK